jgi:hypothetical protein
MPSYQFKFMERTVNKKNGKFIQLIKKLIVIFPHLSASTIDPFQPLTVNYILIELIKLFFYGRCESFRGGEDKILIGQVYRYLFRELIYASADSKSFRTNKFSMFLFIQLMNI